MTGHTFIAQYHGDCDSCGADVKGHEVQHAGFGSLVHVTCPKTEWDKPEGVPLCKDCFLYHNGECP